MLVMMLIFSTTATAFATDNCSLEGQKETIQLTAENVQTFVQEDGTTDITLNLYESGSATRAIKLVGTAKFTLRWHNILNRFEGKWEMRLTNGDKIKGVYGLMIVKKDILGPINPTLVEMEVGEYYRYGTLFNNAEGVEEVNCSKAVDEDDNYIFQ